MNNRRESLIELVSTLVVDPYEDDLLDASPVEGQALCGRCQRFDIQSFAAGRRGYRMLDIQAGMLGGCAFCTLLLDSVRDVQNPTYFGSDTTFGSAPQLDSELWLHMSLSEDYVKRKPRSGALGGLRANRLLVEVGDRFTEVRTASCGEICLAAEKGL